MQLETYISDLLYRYECVTVPEFGAFLTQRVSASINQSTNTFYPPKKVVSFNEQIQKNDGLLAHYVADVEKIPFENALQKIVKRVKSLKESLAEGQTIKFENIGDIRFNGEGKIQFEPSHHLNYLTDAFGLSQFVSPAVTREVYKQEVEAIEKVIPITVTPEKRKSRPYLKYAAVALIALTMGGFAASNYYVNQIKAQNQLAQKEATQQLDAKIQQATFSLNPLPAITLSVTKQSGNYHIVAGAFRVEENCDKKIAQLKELGYKARKIGVNKYGLHEVVYASYEDRLEALNALRDIKKTNNPDAWLKVEDLDKARTQQNSNENPSFKKNLSEVSNAIPNTRKEQAKTVDPSTLVNNPNIIPIINGIDSLESGFYSILGIYSDALKKDSLLNKLVSEGHTNIGSFYDKNSEKYFIYSERFNDLETAKEALTAKRNLQFKRKIAIVKVEN
jgi:CCDC81-like prokaryotic HU domain 2/CCDC81-like prokaryotic HU domain 1/SPOR domain